MSKHLFVVFLILPMMAGCGRSEQSEPSNKKLLDAIIALDSRQSYVETHLGIQPVTQAQPQSVGGALISLPVGRYEKAKQDAENHIRRIENVAKTRGDLKDIAKEAMNMDAELGRRFPDPAEVEALRKENKELKELKRRVEELEKSQEGSRDTETNTTNRKSSNFATLRPLSDEQKIAHMRHLSNSLGKRALECKRVESFPKAVPLYAKWQFSDGDKWVAFLAP